MSAETLALVTYLGVFLAGAICLFFSVRLFGKGRRALQSGVVVSVTRAEHRREEMPLLYWLSVGLDFFNATACAMGGVALLSLPFLSYYNYVRGEGCARPNAEIAALSAALESYKEDHGRYPASDNTMMFQELTGSGQGKTYIEWHTKGPEFLDPWGTPYQFGMNGGYPTIRSAGPNKRFEPGVAKSDDISTK